MTLWRTVSAFFTSRYTLASELSETLDELVMSKRREKDLENQLTNERLLRAVANAKAEEACQRANEWRLILDIMMGAPQ